MLREVARPVGSPAVDVGEAVFLGQSPRAEEAAALRRDLGIGGQRCDRAADEARRLRSDEQEAIRRGVRPGDLIAVLFRLTDIVGDVYGTTAAWRDHDRGGP